MNRGNWASVLSDNCVVTTPLTCYQPFNPLDITNGMKCLNGIDAVMADCASFHTILQGLTPSSDEKVNKTSLQDRACFIQLISN